MSDMKIINFMALRKMAGALSIALVLSAIVSLAVNQLQFGLDFTGGTLIEVGYEQPPSLVDVRVQLETAGFDGAVVQNFGSEKDVLVRLSQTFNDKVGEQVLLLCSLLQARLLSLGVLSTLVAKWAKSLLSKVV